MKFPVGTIVYLKSGSPPLTVSDMPGVNEDCIQVEWFDGNQPRRDVFHQDSLTTERPAAS